MVAFFVSGQLPWMGVKAKNRKEKDQMLIKIKRETSFESLFVNAPQEFVTFMHSVRNLKFEEKPDYTGLKRIFQNLLTKEGHTMDHEFDWVIRKEQLHA